MTKIIKKLVNLEHVQSLNMSMVSKYDANKWIVIFNGGEIWFNKMFTFQTVPFWHLNLKNYSNIYYTAF